MWRVESRAGNWDEASRVGRVRAGPRGLAALFFPDFQELGQAGRLEEVGAKLPVQTH